MQIEICPIKIDNSFDPVIYYITYKMDFFCYKIEEESEQIKSKLKLEYKAMSLAISNIPARLFLPHT